MAKRPEGRLQRRRGDIADLVMFVGKTLADRNVTVYADSARLRGVELAGGSEVEVCEE